MARPAPRARLLSSAFLTVGVVAELSASTRPWARAWLSAQESGTGVPVTLEVTGRDAVPGAVALALVAGAAGVVAVLTRGRVRALVGLLLVVGCVGGAALSSSAVTDPSGALRSAGTRLVADPAAVADAAQATAWGWVGLVVWVLPGLAGALMATAGGRGAETGDLATSRTSSPGEMRSPAQVWEALSRGEDPT